MTSWRGLGRCRRRGTRSTLWQSVGGRFGAEILARKDFPLNINLVGKLPEQVRRPRGRWGRDVLTGSAEPAAGFSCPSLGWSSLTTPNFGAISGNTITNKFVQGCCCPSRKGLANPHLARE